MTKEDLIATAHKNTGQRAANIGIDADALLLFCVQEMCGEHRWSWRKKRLSFTSVAGTATVDLSDTAGADVDDLDEFISLWRIDSSTARSTLDPLLDEADQIAVMDDTTTGDPTAYMWESDLTIRLSPIPSSAKTFRGLYWATPATVDSADGTIPLVPARFHYLLCKRLEAAFLAALPKGQGTEAATLRLNEYQYGLANAKKRDRFSTKEARNYVSSDAAVRST